MQARRGVRGPPGSTIIILKEIIRFKVTLFKYRVDMIQIHGDHNQSISWTWLKYRVSRINDSCLNTVRTKAHQWRLSFHNVWFSFKDDDSFINTVRTKAHQWTLCFQNVWFSWRDNDSCIRTFENTLCFKGDSWESLHENHKKEVTITKNPIWELMLPYKDSL